MAEVKFTIPYPATKNGRKFWAAEYGLNAYYSGKHWSQRKQDAQYWHMLTRAAMDRSKVQRKPFENPVIISFCWNDNLDLSNHAAMAKMIEDAMKGRVIKDDNRRHVQGIEHYFHDKDFIGVIVREVS